MNHNQPNWSVIPYVAAFLIGVILFWSVEKDWLEVQSTSVILAGLIGVAAAVLSFAAWNIYYNSQHKEK